MYIPVTAYRYPLHAILLNNVATYFSEGETNLEQVLKLVVAHEDIYYE